MTHSLEQAEPVEGPLIPEVIDRHSGEIRESRDLLSGERSKVIELRSEVEAGLVRDDPMLLCAACRTPVKVRASVRRRFFLRHIDESGECEYKTRGALDQDAINARRYQGQKEGKDHIAIKRFLAMSIAADARFSAPLLETTWRGIWSPGAWRKPDVQATRDGVRVAFEIQLSTTFINIIAARREFYLREGGLLFWIFKGVNPADRRMMEDDVFIPNNHNLFVADADTAAESARTRRLMLRCHFHVPRMESERIVEEWHHRLVAFDDLTVDLPRQRVYFFDYEGARESIAREKADRDKPLRSRYEQLWLRLPDNRDRQLDLQREYAPIRKELRARGLDFPWDFIDREVYYLMRACYCAKHRRSIGYGYKGPSVLLSIAHNVHDGHKSFMYPFLLLLDEHGGGEQLDKMDRTGVWRWRRATFEDAWRGGHPQRQDVAAPYTQNASHNRLLAFLFPEIGDALL
ncbi:MAG: DUF6035 family protein [Burkholderiales bacterium]